MLDINKWAVVAHKDDTGFGRMAEDFKSVMGTRNHIVIPSERLVDRNVVAPHEVTLRADEKASCVKEVLEGLQGILFFERPDWHPQLLPIAKQLGVVTVCVPMWEWFRGYSPLWEFCDLFACPSCWTLNIVQRYGWQNALHLPWLLDIQRFKRRTITGPAQVFVHNAGLVDLDDRKCTRNTIESFKRVPGKELRLIVRMQKKVELPRLDGRIEVRIGNLDNPADLYAEGDVAVQPSKMEGIGFMVLEPMCSGMPVITTNHPPMNEYINEPLLLAKTRWGKRKANASNWVPHAYLKIPQTGALTQRIQWCSENEMSTLSTRMLQRADELFAPEVLKPLWLDVLSQLCNSSKTINCKV